MSFRCLTGAPRSALGESPVWSVREQALYWVDIEAPAIHRYDPVSGAVRTIAVAEAVGCVGLAASGGFIVGLRSGLWRLDALGQPLAKLADNPEDHRVSRFNDGRCDRAGRFWLGTMDETESGRKAHLYRYDKDGLADLAGGLTISNGLGFSPDNRWLYHSDTPDFTITRAAFDIDTGHMGRREPWVRLPHSATERGGPDGAAVDSLGRYWTALYDGGRIQCYSPDGQLVAEYGLPVRRPTMMAFGGADLRTLYVTTVALDGEAESGCLFAMTADVPGLPEPEFAD